MIDLDREKVIKGLEEAYRVITDYVPSRYRGYSRLACCDAIDLIREQEPVEPDGDNCGECGYTLHRINYDGPDKELRHEWFRFCPSCGKAVKWDAAD